MRVEVLYVDGCPNHAVLLPHLRELLRMAGASADIELRRIDARRGGPGTTRVRP